MQQHSPTNSNLQSVWVLIVSHQFPEKINYFSQIPNSLFPPKSFPPFHFNPLSNSLIWTPLFNFTVHTYIQQRSKRKSQNFLGRLLIFHSLHINPNRKSGFSWPAGFEQGQTGSDSTKNSLILFGNIVVISIFIQQ